jgi:hypothetical protein
MSVMTSGRLWYSQSNPAHSHDSGGVAWSIDRIAPPTSLGWMCRPLIALPSAT